MVSIDPSIDHQPERPPPRIHNRGDEYSRTEKRHARFIATTRLQNMSGGSSLRAQGNATPFIRTIAGLFLTEK